MPWGETVRQARRRLADHGKLEWFDRWVRERWQDGKMRIEGEPWIEFRKRLWGEYATPERYPALSQPLSSEDLEFLRERERIRERRIGG